MTKVIQLIYTDELVGNGKEEEPFQRVRMLYTLEGKLVAREFAKFEGENLKEFYPNNLPV